MLATLRRDWLPPPASTAALSAEGRARLLDMNFDGMRYSTTVIASVAVPLILYLRQYQSAWGFWLWLAIGVLLAAFVWWQHARYRAARRGALSALVQRAWQPLLQRLALLYGAVLTGPLLLTLGKVPLESTLFLYIVLIGITAANVTHHAPMLGVFMRFLLTTWGIAIVSMPWAVPTRWHYFMPLAALFVLGMARHAITAQRFVVEQVRLEEDSQRLADAARAAHAAAEQALAERNRFLATASHDLRQPVHAMSMLVEAIARRSHDAPLKPLLADLKTSMSALGLMFNSLLDLSRIEAGAQATQAEPLDLRAVLAEVAALFREQAAQRGLALRVRLPARGATVLADAALLRQALGNLVHNALRYTPRGGVLLGARRRGARWSVQVWDTGVGVASDDEAHIFSPYFRSQHAWTADSAGHGLGLAVVARCAVLMEASLTLRSRLGRGSCFGLELAAADWHGADARPRPPGNATLPRLTGRCLVLDDDPLVVAALQSLLAGWGIDARCVTTAAAALAALEDGFAPAAILCDQRLRSGESGFEVLQALLARCPAASGAMVSGEFDSTALQEADAEGYLVLRKPVDADELRALLERWLSPAPPAPPLQPALP